MKGIAEGASDAGAKWQGRRIDLIDMVTANTIVEMGELRAALPMTPTGLEGLHLKSPQYAGRDMAAADHCSAFAATGKATKRREDDCALIHLVAADAGGTNQRHAGHQAWPKVITC